MNLRKFIDALHWRRPTIAASTPADLATHFVKQWLEQQQPVKSSSDRLIAKNELADYFETHREGPGVWKWRHYFDIYERHLSKFVGHEAHIVEIGIYSGGSLKMWRQYFGTRCHITGIDIQEACRAYAEEGTTIVIGDQADRGFWRECLKSMPPIDVLIDDGGHTYEQQRATLEELLPYMRPGAVYLCEDVHGVNNEFAIYAHTLANQLNAFHSSNVAALDGELVSSATSFQQSIRSIHFYPFVVVIEKVDEGLEHFVAPRRGSQWEPFL